MVEINTLYKHTKSGKLYRILNIGYEEARMQKVVVYQAQYDDEELGNNPIFVRPQVEFLGKIWIDGVEVPRFTQVTFNTLQFITGNAKKFAEAQSMLADSCEITQLNLDLPEIQSLDETEILIAKINAAKDLGYRNFFVDDVSVRIHAWHNFPGPLIKWVNKTISHDVYKFLPVTDTQATAVCTIGYSDIRGNTHVFSGEIKGNIVSPRGTDFGFNPIFLPDGESKTLSEMSHEEKCSMNHRAKAMNLFKAFLLKNELQHK
jgi:inosine triphosphate pyrophosphatase